MEKTGGDMSRQPCRQLGCSYASFKTARRQVQNPVARGLTKQDSRSRICTMKGGHPFRSSRQSFRMEAPKVQGDRLRSSAPGGASRPGQCQALAGPSHRLMLAEAEGGRTPTIDPIAAATAAESGKSSHIPTPPGQQRAAMPAAGAGEPAAGAAGHDVVQSLLLAYPPTPPSPGPTEADGAAVPAAGAAQGGVHALRLAYPITPLSSGSSEGGANSNHCSDGTLDSAARATPDLDLSTQQERLQEQVAHLNLNQEQRYPAEDSPSMASLDWPPIANKQDGPSGDPRRLAVAALVPRAQTPPVLSHPVLLRHMLHQAGVNSRALVEGGADQDEVRASAPLMAAMSARGRQQRRRRYCYLGTRGAQAQGEGQEESGRPGDHSAQTGARTGASTGARTARVIRQVRAAITHAADKAQEMLLSLEEQERKAQEMTQEQRALRKAMKANMDEMTKLTRVLSELDEGNRGLAGCSHASVSPEGEITDAEEAGTGGEGSGELGTGESDAVAGDEPSPAGLAGCSHAGASLEGEITDAEEAEAGDEPPLAGPSHEPQGSVCVGSAMLQGPREQALVECSIDAALMWPKAGPLIMADNGSVAEAIAQLPAARREAVIGTVHCLLDLARAQNGNGAAQLAVLQRYGMPPDMFSKMSTRCNFGRFKGYARVYNIIGALRSGSKRAMGNFLGLGVQVSCFGTCDGCGVWWALFAWYCLVMAPMMGVVVCNCSTWAGTPTGT
eukprot:jgi/Ulvmu1/11128/UM071_0011.1